jgi:hypothetical protein
MLDAQDIREIDRRVGRLLREAGARYRFPTPVDDIIAAQRLRMARDDDSLFAPNVLAAAPAFLQEKLRSFQHKLLAVLDRRERLVHVEPDGLEVQKRFWSCHEVGHDLCPWHPEPHYVDGWAQLAPGVRERFEQEANYAAARLLFQQGVFDEVARGQPPGVAAVDELATRFGSSKHAAFRQYVETNLHSVAGIVLGRSPTGTNASGYRFRVKQVFASHPFIQHYAWLDSPPATLDASEYPQLASAWDELRRHDSPVQGSLAVISRTGEVEHLRFELFSNTYNLFLLLVAYRR